MILSLNPAWFSALMSGSLISCMSCQQTWADQWIYPLWSLYRGGKSLAAKSVLCKIRKLCNKCKISKLCCYLCNQICARTKVGDSRQQLSSDLIVLSSIDVVLLVHANNSLVEREIWAAFQFRVSRLFRPYIARLVCTWDLVQLHNQSIFHGSKELGTRACREWIFFSPQKSTFSPQSIFYPLFLNEDGRILKKSLSKLHYWLRRYSTLTKTVFYLNLNICKVMTVFLIFLGQNLKKIVITLQILRFKRNWLRHSWISSKSIMQLTKTFFSQSAIFIEKMWVENRLLGKSGFLWGEKMYHLQGDTKPFPCSFSAGFWLLKVWLGDSEVWWSPLRQLWSSRMLELIGSREFVLLTSSSESIKPWGKMKVSLNG